MKRTQSLLAVAVSAVFPIHSFAQSAADYPSKPVRVVVPAGAGGGNDINARIVVQKLSEVMKRTFTIDNRSGGSGTIGYEIVAQSPPDGYTLLAVGTSFTSVPALLPAFKYHPAKHYAAIIIKLSEEFARAVSSADLIKRFSDDVGAPIGSTPEQFRQTITEEVPRWDKVVKETGMRVE